MKTFGRTYWFTWAFLVLAAALTGVASLKDAFFGGLVAAMFSTALTRVYARSGVSFAPLIGAAAGALWVLLMLLKSKWWGYAEDYEQASWTLGVDISVHAAGFAGAGLMTALLLRWSLGRSALAGFALAAAMTAIPYGFIAWVDHRVAGPVEVVLLVSSEVPSEQGPYRAPGAVVAQLSPEEIKELKQNLLVVLGPGGEEVIDEQGRRYWPLWRHRLIYPGNPGGPVRTTIVILPPDVMGRESWNFPLSLAPSGLQIVNLGSGQKVSTTNASVSQAVTLKVVAETKGEASTVTVSAISFEVSRSSPVGSFYRPVAARSFPAAFARAPVIASPVIKKDVMRRPSFDTPAEAIK
ncbi:MAG: hypothetical protein D4R66_00460 [Opitutales bacterium]|nr:MAG: hypothetical protein D4R66_00460 [Opitutales bacterium]